MIDRLIGIIANLPQDRQVIFDADLAREFVEVLGFIDDHVNAVADENAKLLAANRTLRIENAELLAANFTMARQADVKVVPLRALRQQSSDSGSAA